MDGNNTNKMGIIAIYLPIIAGDIEGRGYSDEVERLINELLSLSGKIKSWIQVISAQRKIPLTSIPVSSWKAS